VNGDGPVRKEEPIPRVGVGVLLVNAHKGVLLTLRERAPEAGCWSIVGGKVDFMERLEQCGVREAREEAAWKSNWWGCCA
jgi:ADP-ribose pyrophosphatase YjhB (NUDIX family)